MAIVKPVLAYRVQVEAEVIPNYGLVYKVDETLQKQLEDLKAMRELSQTYRVNVYRPSLGDS
jgi:hypothetical protein